MMYGNMRAHRCWQIIRGETLHDNYRHQYAMCFYSGVVMKNLVRILAFAFLLLTTSCSYEQLSEKLIPKEESQFAEGYLQKLHDKDFAYVRRYLDESIASATDEELLKMTSYFPNGNLVDTKIIG